MSTPNNQTSNNQNPTAVWQGIWGNLIFQVINQMTQKEYYEAYKSIDLLKGQLPPECEEEVEKDFEKLKKAFNITAEGYYPNLMKKQINIKYATTGQEELKNCLRAVKKTLFKNGWINKDFSVKPRAGTANIEVPE